MDAKFPVLNAWYPILREPMEHVRGTLLAEKWSSTNRIRSQFARIKAAGQPCYQLWLLRKTGLFGFKARRFRKNKRQGISQSESQDISKTKVRTFRSRKSGNVRTIGRRDQAAHGAGAGLDQATGTASRFGLDHPPSAAIGQQGRQHGVVQLVATAHGAIGTKQRETSQRQIANGVQRLVAGTLVGKAKPFNVGQTGFVEYHRILKRGATRKAGAPKPRDVVHEAERPGAGHLAAET